MNFNPLHCWDCGTPVLLKTTHNIEPTFDMRQVKFRLGNGSYCESTFCHSCAIRPWPPERLRDFEAAVNAVRPKNDQIHVTACEGFRMLTEPVAGVLGRAQ